MGFNITRAGGSHTATTSKREQILNKIRKLEARKRKLLGQGQSSEKSGAGKTPPTGNAGKSIALPGVNIMPVASQTTAGQTGRAALGGEMGDAAFPNQKQSAPAKEGINIEASKTFLAQALYSQDSSDETEDSDLDSQLSDKDRLKMISLIQSQILALRSQLNQEDQSQLDAENKLEEANDKARSNFEAAKAAVESRYATDLPAVAVESTPTADGGTTLSVDGYA